MSRPSRSVAAKRDKASGRAPVFAARVLAVVRRIPAGRVATYGDVAAAAGSPRAHRAVGNIMRNCSARDVPCHRVVAAAGHLGGYGGNVGIKRALLAAEGVRIVGSRIRDFLDRRWGPHSRSGRPRTGGTSRT